MNSTELPDGPEREAHFKVEAARRAGVSLDAVHAMSPVDIQVSTILFNAVGALRNLSIEATQAGEEPDLVIPQTIDQLNAMNPIYVHEQVHQAAASLLGPQPPTTGQNDG
ncbi:hypothetical protein [Umezawaea tangerina]|uniref:Uncharacterized protein n=1 Tax=Umezawaea tangerina TaxID=84725 RepID=A0A2T0TCB9_9PSEU|nr:hypothetical protein [Umezawaea tangerina]PRY43312.1 hypothetical protein CLV43_10352 [Umezawaea tangerina]